MSALLLLLWLAAGAQDFRLEGQVSLDTGRLGGRAVLASPDGSFVRRARISRSGRFEFKSIRAGSYWLTIAIPGFEDERRTVEVRPGLADSDGRIRFDVELPARRSEAGHTVSVDELEIPREALREYQRALGAEGDIDRVRRHLERAIEIAPGFDQALNNLGTTYHHEGNYERSIELFQRALEVRPDFYHARVNLGGSLLAAGRLDEALDENREALALRPDSSLANAQTGIALFLLGRYREAIPYFEAVKRVDPVSMNTPELYLADIHVRLGELERAVGELEEFLEKRPGHPATERVRERLQLLGGRIH